MHDTDTDTEQKLVTDTEQKLVEKLASAVCASRMQDPALFILESIGPLNFLLSQLMHFSYPLMHIFLQQGALGEGGSGGRTRFRLSAREYRELAGLLERRDAVERLIRALQAEAQL
ncbi:MAG: hypothetical protein AAF355_04800 [Myxococcota bacterium]